MKRVDVLSGRVKVNSAVLALSQKMYYCVSKHPDCIKREKDENIYGFRARDAINGLKGHAVDHR